MKYFTALIFAAMLVGCSNTKNVLKPLPLKKFDATANIEVVWKKDVGKGQDVRFTQLVPAILGDTIYTVDVDGLLMALDRRTGREMWKRKISDRISGGVGAANNMLFVGTYDAQVIALSAADGSEVWRQTVSSEVLAPPKSNGRFVAVQTLDDSLFVFDHTSGQPQWDFEVTSALLTVRGTSSPTVTNDAVYAGFSNGLIYALQLEDGLSIWNERVAVPKGRGDFEKMVDIDASPLLVSDILVSASFQGQIVAFSRATGRALWSKPISTSHNLANGQGKIYASDDQSSVKAYNVGNGEIVWENNQLLRRKVYAPQVAGGYVAVIDQEGGVMHVLDQTDGSFAARKKIDGGGVRSPMITDGEILYVFTDDGDLLALRITPM